MAEGASHSQGRDTHCSGMVKINRGGLKRNITGIHANFRSQRSPLSTQTGGTNNGSEDLVTHMVTRYAGPHLEHRAGEITPYSTRELRFL